MSASEEEGLPIVCTALNASIDKRLHLAALIPGQVHRVKQMEATAGGKGLNVARVVHTLGAAAMASGFAGGSNGSWVRGQLDQAGIQHDLVEVAGETRVCLNIVDDSIGISTEVLESGPEILPEEKEAFVRIWRRLCTRGRWLTLSGSLPLGLGDEFYGQLITEANQQGACVLLDTSGSALEKAVRCGPHTVKPNESEFRQWAHADPRDENAVRRVAEQLGRVGVRTVIVSLGSEGCIAATPEGEIWRAVPPAIRAVNPVGSGDAFVAGWAVARSRGSSLPEALRLATAAGTANAMTQGTGCVRLEDVEELIGRIRLESRF
jgi:tagatose 6-phosphate kinase